MLGYPLSWYVAVEYTFNATLCYTMLCYAVLAIPCYTLQLSTPLCSTVLGSDILTSMCYMYEASYVTMLWHALQFYHPPWHRATYILCSAKVRFPMPCHVLQLWSALYHALLSHGRPMPGQRWHQFFHGTSATTICARMYADQAHSSQVNPWSSPVSPAAYPASRN